MTLFQGTCQACSEGRHEDCTGYVSGRTSSPFDDTERDRYNPDVCGCTCRSVGHSPLPIPNPTKADADETVDEKD